VGTERSGRRISKLRTEKSARGYEGPIVALIGPYSASAAEIAAAALLDNKRGKLIGRNTKGAVLASEYFPLPDGGRVLMAAHDYVRSGDRRIEGVGVEPDIRVVPTLEEIRAGRDPVVERAVAELRTPR
jgi:carboxyl-terminal processing protease